MVLEQLARRELIGRVGVGELVHRVDELVGAVEIDEAERSSPEWREADSEHGGNVSVLLKLGDCQDSEKINYRSGDDTLLETDGCLVHEARDETELTVLGRRARK